MDRTVQDLRNRIANLEAQRDAIADALCGKNKEAEAWKRRCKEFAQAVRLAEIAEEAVDDELERELDEILDEMDDDDEDLDEDRPRPCIQCGAYPYHGCRCFDRFPGTRIPDLF